MLKEMIAPCGINCSLCSGHQRKKNTCPGCNFLDENSPLSCKSCRIVHCENRKDFYFCIDCQQFPCRRLKDLQKRYSRRYGVDNFENMRIVKVDGIDEFLQLEMNKWKCSECGELLCMHKKL